MRRRGKGAAVFLLYFGLAVAYQWWYGAFEREFDGYPDEPAHYVTGVMAREYLLTGFPRHPIRFAEDYYVHYPKVAIGHWPPMFYVLEAVWMLVFGVSRASALLMVAAFAALLASMLHAAVGRRLGTMYAFWAGAILLSIRLVQRQAGMVMVELPLTVFAFGAMLALAAFLEKGVRRYSVMFGLAAAGAIWTKGDGFALALVPPLALLLLRDWKPARRAAFWIAVPIVAVLCVPLVLFTLELARHGWSAEKPGIGLAAGFAVEAGGILWWYAGWGLLALAAYGLWDRLLRPLARHERPEPFWACGAAYAAAVLGFQIGMPAGMEPRKLVMLAPALALLAAAGCERLARSSLASRAPARARAPVVLALAAAVFAVQHRPAQPREFRKLDSFAAAIRPSLGPVTMIAADAVGEGTLIARLATLEPHPRRVVLRATKQLADISWNASTSRLLFQTPAEVTAELERMPVNTVILETRSAGSPMPHEALVARAMREYPDRWRRIHDYCAVGGEQGCADRFEVYALRSPRAGPKDIQVDLRSRIGRVLGTGR